MKLDATDIQILDLLQQNARLTTREIAEKVGKASTPVYERVRRLEQEGYIRQYVALLDRRKIGRKLVAFTAVQLRQHEHLMIRKFEQDIVCFPEVMECFHMTGTNDYMLKVIVQDMDEYQHFIVHKLAKLDNIGTVQSSFVMTEIKWDTAFVL